MLRDQGPSQEEVKRRQFLERAQRRKPGVDREMRDLQRQERKPRNTGRK